MVSALIDKLRDRGAIKMVVEFSGSGDDGSVNSVGVVGLRLKNTNVRIGHTVTADDFEEFTEAVEYRSGLWSEAQILAENAGFDWWNNEGGAGTITVDVAASTATYERYEYVQETKPLPELVKDV